MKPLRPLVAALIVAVPGLMPAAEIAGRVIDAWSRLPVPFAEVFVPATGQRIAADSLGRFRVASAEEDSVELIVSRVGYASTSWSGRKGSAVIVLQPVTLRLDGVTVSTARTPLPLHRAGTVRIWSRESVRRPAAAGLVEVFRSAPDAGIIDYANYSSLTMRGASAEHTLIALDGIPQNSAQNGLGDLSTIAPTLVERLEMARGPGSAVFGSSALGGVANIITPEPDRLGAEAVGGLSSFGGRHVGFRQTGWTAPLGWVFAGELSAARNDFVFTDSTGADRRLNNADFARTAALAKGRFQSGPHRASLLGEISFCRRGVPGSVSFPSDSARRDDNRAQFIARYSVQPSGSLRSEIRLHAARNWQNYRDPGWAVNDTHRTSVEGIIVDQFWQAGRSLSLAFAAEHSNQRLNSSAIGQPQRSILAGTFQFRVQLHGFDVTHILRYDRSFSRTGRPDSLEQRSTLAVLSPRVMATFSDSSLPLEIYSSLGRSFRLPTFNELYWPADAFTYGNPRLRPEHGNTADIGIATTGTGPARLRIGGFYSRFNDLIQWQPDSGFRFRPVNIDRARILGLELETGLHFKPVTVELSGTWNDARSESLVLTYRPALTGSGQLHFEPAWPNLAPRLTVAARYTGRRFADPANTDTLPGFTVIDAGLQLAPRIGPVAVNGEIGLRNLLDSRYETARGYPAPGRSWYLDVGLKI